MLDKRRRTQQREKKAERKEKRKKRGKAMDRAGRSRGFLIKLLMAAAG